MFNVNVIINSNQCLSAVHLVIFKFDACTYKPLPRIGCFNNQCFPKPAHLLLYIANEHL